MRCCHIFTLITAIITFPFLQHFHISFFLNSGHFLSIFFPSLPPNKAAFKQFQKFEVS